MKGWDARRRAKLNLAPVVTVTLYDGPTFEERSPLMGTTDGSSTSTPEPGDIAGDQLGT